MSSPFEKLPPELKYSIFEYCLVNDKEIVPFPAEYERPELDAAAVEGTVLLGARPPNPRQKQASRAISNGDVKYTEGMPCIALLAVSRIIQDEAATILFGQNVWHLLDYVNEYNDNGNTFECQFRNRYLWYCRHLKVKFDFRMVSSRALLEVTRKCRRRISQDRPPGGMTDAHLKRPIHDHRFDCLMQVCWNKSFLVRTIVVGPSMSARD